MCAGVVCFVCVAVLISSNKKMKKERKNQKKQERKKERKRKRNHREVENQFLLRLRNSSTNEKLKKNLSRQIKIQTNYIPSLPSHFFPLIPLFSNY